MSELLTGINNESGKNRKEDIDSKIADFMADIDEIVLGKKSNTNNDEESEWKQCFDETTQSVYYWNIKTNECSWDPPPTGLQNHVTEISHNSTDIDGINQKKRQQITTDIQSMKKLKKPSFISEYPSSDSESTEDDDEENIDEIDELLNEVLEKEEKVDNKVQQIDLYPLFETDYRAAIARLTDLSDRTAEIFTLRIQLETRLEDCLAGYLSKLYAVNKLDEALLQIEEFEKSHPTIASPPIVTEPSKPPLTSSEMALLLSLPPPPPPPSPPPLSSSTEDDKTLQLFYAQLNCDQPEQPTSICDMEKPSTITKSEQQPHHHQHHHKDKKSKPAKTLPTDLIQKWTHARQELRGIADIDDS
ncbi:unnamed protein product [Adineta steineri]|uniref:WW domain-containing protein n=1 Tax=Adineta steineri TaxID=433720 RepID=A0A814ZPY2_9BILA|nr:unnamed protein product [Adineta steineri]CAF1244778.1 unnamed protein product [Adineta steineri]